MDDEKPFLSLEPEVRIDPSRAKDRLETKVLDDVRKSGVHILSVFDEEGKTPEFSYTVGLWHTHGHPEIIIVGLKTELREILLNNLNYQIGGGRTFYEGSSATDVLDGYRCYFQELPKMLYHEYLGVARWFYAGNGFPAVQMFWPTVHGLFPWDRNASENLQWQQTMLAKKPLIVS